MASISTLLRVIFIFVSATTLFSSRCLAGDENAQAATGRSDLSKLSWQFGVYTQGGYLPDYHADVSSSQYANLEIGFLSSGIEAGIQTRQVKGQGMLRGRGEALLEVIPFWIADYPKQYVTFNNQSILPGNMDNQCFHGVSVTPFLLRWNFIRHNSAHLVPWAQLGGGLLWTNHNFPLEIFSGPPARTSRINFTPQFGAGLNVFNRPKRSVNFAMKFIHYSSANLGTYNPSIRLTYQLSAGYSWWK